MKLYHELADWWPLVSPPADYAEEADLIATAMESIAGRPLQSILELGSGGGNTASHLAKRFRMTLVDASPEMLAVSRALNSDCEHFVGDMRTVRLGREFDAVLIHDAIMYMTTEDDLAAAIRTAAAHLAPGGVAAFVPDVTAETFRPRTDCGGHDGDGRGLRYLEWSHEPAAGATSAVVTYVFVLKEGAAPPRVVLDMHVEGIFPRATWLRLIEQAGLTPRVVPYPLSCFDPNETHEIFCGVR